MTPTRDRNAKMILVRNPGKAKQINLHEMAHQRQAMSRNRDSQQATF